MISAGRMALWWDATSGLARNLHLRKTRRIALHDTGMRICTRSMTINLNGTPARNEESTKGRVAVALSGGVDSSVAALLLQRAGYDIFGVHMRNWDEEEEKGEHRGAGHCSSAQDLLDVKNTCKALDIPLREVSFVREYWTRVFEPTLQGYCAGITPNPDVMCNREIKFDALLDTAMSMGASALATGHYARLSPPEHEGAPARLLRAVDEWKDQSYFLSSVSGHRLADVMFPLGGLLKTQVRAIAVEAGLPSAAKRESMGLCFVGKRDFKSFISQYVPPQAPGRFVSVEGEDLGPNEGAHLYTIGQGARISGAKDKWFVVAKDVTSGKVTVALGTHHPALFSTSFQAGPPVWISGSPPSMPLRCKFRVRHQQPLADCVVVSVTSDTQCSELSVHSDQPVRAVAPGQVVALYVGDECLGSAPIRSVHVSSQHVQADHPDRSEEKQCEQ